LYDPIDHSLQQTNDTDVRGTMAATLLNQPGAPAGGCQIVIAASSREFGARYGSRSRSIMLLQAGRMSQNLHLQAVALGLTFVGIDAVDAAGARRVARLSRDIEPVYAAIVGYPASLVPETSPGQPSTVDVGATRALIVLPSQGFQNEEYLGTRRALEVAGVQVSVASTRMGMVTGVGGGTVRPDMLLNQANVENYDAIVFIGGVGAIDYFNSPVALNLARQAATRRKVLAAIGTAPSILAGAGVLQGVRSTAFLSEQGRMIQGGAMYTGNPVEKDNLIVTAVGPVAVGTFGQAILDGLAEVRQSGGR
jgi:protease I